MLNDPHYIKSLIRLTEQMNRELRSQAIIMGTMSNPFIESARRWAIELQPVVESFRQIQENAMKVFDMTIRENSILQVSQELVAKLSIQDRMDTFVPLSLYENIENFIHIAIDLFPDEELIDDINEQTTHVESKPTDVKPRMTWDTVKWLIGIFMSALLALYIQEQATEQTERHHQEKMAELRAQTKILEMDLERRQMFEESFAEFLQSISDHLSNMDEEDDPESPDKAPDSPQ
ncbi:hypothetical protein DUZ99_02275 [Xylanibacillus composti]|uniref:Uncharacterized protein n=1 Tax=Xylanibacillus composti TaxID=1572762 RepID=A0A8J4M122_9BACL|nr:hypothetical protein [Xylanibacillus composti]MDT9723822.1 hypothetical protein [Xylanibacillus composti]GIQ67402.1 hypothetical protein XYCOK13_02260 [Xylanibacillus composti]